MSMELYVLSDRRLDSIEVWQNAIDKVGDPLRLSTAIPFSKLHGALPVIFRGRRTAFECDHWNAATLIAESSRVDFDRRWTHALAFRWGGDLAAAVSAYLAAATYARATSGRILDCAEGKLISPSRAREIAVELEQGAPLIAEAVRRAVEKFRK